MELFDSQVWQLLTVKLFKRPLNDVCYQLLQQQTRDYVIRAKLY